ncbi:LuxR C-terminal-related transcriptional regulator [Pistricoccus aurantiacus]|uniref:DNA-binding response regulator n=1 Tax=Pistricoccus aurantiacus TaxID=1883414 RepID=A0A5B8SNR8_9GAMM|nr:LuxR C-terminal-related transcriptional regulator [Pistricoccus aurantiacus]QEA38356.1 DNA-binding response regulator [Pistricoccus aurantiacus]
MSQTNEMVLLVTDSNPQSQLFVDYIHRQVACSVTCISPEASIDDIECDKLLILMDAGYVSEDAMQQWHYRSTESDNITLAAFNLRDEDHATEVLASLHLQGIFYRSDSLELICKGIITLLQGDIWMSRSLMRRLIDFYRRQQLNTYRPICGLTQREIEIIGLLGSGSSNTEIADKLFVSEHTVKSHLYNIFRKINVHNRIQAMNWAKQNLGLPIPTAKDAKHRSASR